MGSNPSRWFIALALVLGAGALPVAGSADTGPVPVNSPACLSVLPAADPDLARTLVAAINRTRRTHGLRPLAYSGSLTSAATEHARALATAGTFTHAWPTTGQFFSSWIRGFYPARGYRAWSAGENLLWAAPGFTPASAVQQWLDSPAHRRVLLTKSWRELGIGVVSAVAAPGTYGGRDVQIAAAEFGLRRP
ncbi:MAG: CAP domain-containing protein [Gaiellaceae bacterium]